MRRCSGITTSPPSSCTDALLSVPVAPRFSFLFVDIQTRGPARFWSHLLRTPPCHGSAHPPLMYPAFTVKLLWIVSYDSLFTSHTSLSVIYTGVYLYRCLSMCATGCEPRSTTYSLPKTLYCPPPRIATVFEGPYTAGDTTLSPGPDIVATAVLNILTQSPLDTQLSASGPIAVRRFPPFKSKSHQASVHRDYVYVFR